MFEPNHNTNINNLGIWNSNANIKEANNIITIPITSNINEKYLHT